MIPAASPVAIDMGLSIEKMEKVQQWSTLQMGWCIDCHRTTGIQSAGNNYYKALHAIGAAPVIIDGDLVLAESGAVVEYIMARYGDGRLALNSGHRDFAPYLYWFHFANGTLQASMGRNMILNRLSWRTIIRCCWPSERASIAPSTWSRRGRRKRNIWRVASSRRRIS